jgi:hypothetical protein
MVELPRVTLVTVDSVANDLTAKALEDTYVQIEPYTAINSMGGHDSIAAVEECMWYQIPTLLTTSHALFIQYDGWVLDGSLWRDEWLRYDYIGAPWPWHAGYQVGNGGFSLRSRKLMQFLADNRTTFPVRTPEDDTLCRAYRPFLESHGFRWAPTMIAEDFSFERERPHRTFGFHGIFNWPHVLSPEGLAERKALANDYVRGKVEWKELP